MIREYHLKFLLLWNQSKICCHCAYSKKDESVSFTLWCESNRPNNQTEVSQYKPTGNLQNEETSWWKYERNVSSLLFSDKPSLGFTEFRQNDAWCKWFIYFASYLYPYNPVSQCACATPHLTLTALDRPWALASSKAYPVSSHEHCHSWAVKTPFKKKSFSYSEKTARTVHFLLK